MLIYDNAHIDSLSLSIPFSVCKIINKSLTSRIVTYYYDTEEFDEELQNGKPLLFSYDGITIRFRIAERLTGTNNTEKFIILTLSSKLLKERYFQGLTIYNIRQVYNEIIKLNVINLDFADFLLSRVSDVDLCTNYKISEEAFYNSNKKIISLAQAGKDRYFNFFAKRDKYKNFTNLGLEVNSRAKAKPSTPYFKNYYKSIELRTKSLEFYSKFLKFPIDKVGRIEYTIKGYKHRQRLIKQGYLKEDFKTLNDLLRISSDKLKRIIYSGFKEYCDLPKENNTERNYSDYSPTDMLILEYMEKLINKGCDKIDLFEPLNKLEGTRKSRLKNKIEFLYKNLTTHNKNLNIKQEQNEELQEFFRKIKDNTNDTK